MSTINAAVSPLDGVSGVEVDLAAGQVTVDGTPDIAAVTAVIEDAGYDVSPAVSAR